MPWKGVTVSEQRQRFLEDYKLNYYPIAKLGALMPQRDRKRELPAVSTAALILARQGLARSTRRYRRAHPGCPKTIPQGPNDIWAADYKGQFRLKNGQYCFPLTVSDLASRYILGVG